MTESKYITKINKSYTFILPMCNINYKSLPNNFKNTYLNNIHDINPQLILEFTYDNIDSFLFDKFVHFIINTNSCYNCKIDNGTNIYYVFNIPNNFIPDFKHFLNGSYSLFSEKYKQILIDIFGRQSNKESKEPSMIDVLYPADYKITQLANELEVDKKLIKELWDKPDLQKEILPEIQTNI